MSTNLTLTVAVFAMGEDLVLIRLEDDDAERAVSDAASCGYKYAGCIAVTEGRASVDIEDGFAPNMACAGGIYAEMLGTELKQIQEAN